MPRWRQVGQRELVVVASEQKEEEKQRWRVQLYQTFIPRYVLFQPDPILLFLADGIANLTLLV